MSAVATRADQIRRYVECDALESFLHGGPGEIFRDLLEQVDTDELMVALTTGMLDDLWPEDDDLNSDEHQRAVTESLLLAAQLWARVAAEADETVSYYLGLVAKRLPPGSPDAVDPHS